MDVHEYLEEIPYQDFLGIELVSAEAGSAEMKLPLREDLSSSRHRLVAHGGVITALADSVGGAAAISLNEVVTPTVDLRVDFLAPAETDLLATGDVCRNGATLSTIDIEIHDTAGTHVATGNGVYKTSGGAPMEWVDPDSGAGGA